MRWMWKGAKGVFAASNAASQAAAGHLQMGATNWGLRRDMKAAQRGVVGPWDPPIPPGASGYYDYSGLAKPEDIGAVSDEFPLGRYVVPKGKWKLGEPIGLDASALITHTAVIAPTGSGKTASVIAPWIYGGLRSGYLVVAVDVKGNGDLMNEVQLYGKTQTPLGGAPIIAWNYRDPGKSAQWNWLAEMDSDGAINAAVEAICGRPSDNDPNKNFHLRDMKYLRGLLELQRILSGNVTVRQLVRILEDPLALDALVNQGAHLRGAGRLRELCNLSRDEYSKAVQFVLTHLETLDIDGFVAVTTHQQLDMRNLDSFIGCLLIANAPVADQALAAEASGLFLSQLLFRRLQSFGSASTPMLLILDEAPRLQDRLDLGALLSMARGANISVVIAAQDVTQFKEEIRSEVLSNCSNFVCLPGVSQATTDYFAGRLGTRRQTVVAHSRTQDRLGSNGATVSRSIQEVVALSHAEISSPPFSSYSAIVHSRSLSHKPILVDLTRPDL
jgi:hypothetical protein